MEERKFTYTPKLPPIKDPVRYPKIQSMYEAEFLENYKKTLKVIKASIVAIIK